MLCVIIFVGMNLLGELEEGIYLTIFLTIATGMLIQCFARLFLSILDTKKDLTDAQIANIENIINSNLGGSNK